MSPEQLINSQKADPLNDLYSTGATLYRLLTGKFPHDAESASAMLAAILNSEPIPLSSREASLPATLCDIVHRSLDRDPDRRFQSALEMREALVPFGRRPS
jgi:serine/threonine-protein kinase